MVDENLVIGLIVNQKLSYEQASSVLEERFPGVVDLSFQSVRRFCSERSISSRVSTEKLTEMVMEAPSKVISSIVFMFYFIQNINVNHTFKSIKNAYYRYS